MSTLESIQEKIVRLPADAQDELLMFVDYLEEKFSTPSVSDEEYQKLLEAELSRRVEALQSGKSKRYTEEEVDTYMKVKFGW